jgi:hypothetical protein
MIIKTDTFALANHERNLSQCKALLTDISNLFKAFEIHELNNMQELQELISEPDTFTRNCLVKKMQGQTLNGIKLSEKKLLELVELPENFTDLTAKIDLLKTLINRQIVKINYSMFGIQNGILVDDEIEQARAKSQFDLEAKTEIQKEKYLACMELIKAIEQAKKVLGIDLINQLKRCKVFDISADYTVNPNPNYILN